MIFFAGLKLSIASAIPDALLYLPNVQILFDLIIYQKL